jgi:anti-sigma-K factor RskA
MNETGDHETMMDLVAAYALGILPPSEHRLVTAYILEYPEARREFEMLRPTADLIGLAAEEPVDSARSARMKQRLMTSIGAPATLPLPTLLDASRRPGTQRSSWFIGAGLAAAAAVVFALVSTIQNFSLRGDLANANARTAALQAQIAQNERVRLHDREMVADLVAGDAQRFPVREGEVVKRGAHVYLVLRSLPPLPRGKVYQAWTQAKGSKVVAPSVVFTPSSTGAAVVALPENAETLALVALSVEPEGGSKSPTSKPTFVRPLS